MVSRNKRLHISTTNQERLKSTLRQLGFMVVETGQENWLPNQYHEQIRRIHNDPTVDLLRYFPDLATFRPDWGCLLVQSKATTPEYYDGENFSIETASLGVDRRLYQIGVKVLIVFENRPNEFYATWPESIEPVASYEYTETRTFTGSHTPMTLIRKDSIPKLEQALQRITT